MVAINLISRELPHLSMSTCLNFKLISLVPLFPLRIQALLTLAYTVPVCDVAALLQFLSSLLSMKLRLLSLRMEGLWHLRGQPTPSWLGVELCSQR